MRQLEEWESTTGQTVSHVTAELQCNHEQHGINDARDIQPEDLIMCDTCNTLRKVLTVHYHFFPPPTIWRNGMPRILK